MVTVRRVAPGDGPLLQRVRLAALADSPAAFSSTYEQEVARCPKAWAERAAAGSEGSERATFFAERNGAIVGLVGGYRPERPSESVELVSMWVAPEARRLWIGQLLVDAVVDWARATGAVEVRAGVIMGNTRAEQLYRSKGFVPTGEAHPVPSAPSRTEVGLTLRLV